MKYVTQQVINKFNVSEEVAFEIVDHMISESGLDFSECTQREFDAAASESYLAVVKVGA
jgi:hypothetical protein